MIGTLLYLPYQLSYNHPENVPYIDLICSISTKKQQQQQQQKNENIFMWLVFLCRFKK